MFQKVILGKSRSTTVQHVIHGTPKSGTYADFMLLSQEYRRLDPPPNVVKKRERFKQLIFNTNFLKAILKEYGELHCEYCGYPDLKIYHWTQKPNFENMATVDHFLPASQNPDLKRDVNNFVVCCHSCNQVKKDNIWDKDTIKHPYKNKECYATLTSD